MPAQTRYADTNTWTVNGLLGQKHITDYDYLTQYTQTIYNAVLQRMYVAIRAWKRTSGGVETEIGTPGTYKAIANGIPTLVKTTISGTWTYPTTTLNPTDCLVVRVYCRLIDSNFVEADLAYTLVTEQLGAQSLDTATLTMLIRINYSGIYDHNFWFGWFTIYGEPYENFSLGLWTWTPYVPAVVPQAIGDGLTWIMG